MGRDHNRRPQAKRRFRQVEEELEIVDDLAHAAQFAIFPDAALPLLESSLEATVSPSKKEDDGNEIEVDEDDDSDGEDDSDASIADADDDDAKEKEDDNNGEDVDDDSSDDDESDEDLVEALQRMEDANAAEEEAGGSASNPPKTENEVDGYKVPIQELESQLQIRLTVDEKVGTNNKDINDDQLSLAGRIINYMIVDRTVVVHSVEGQQTKGPLDEGSMLVVKMPQSYIKDSVSETLTSKLIPLGRIFEVFGPVSQPLYTIRLPSSPSELERKKKSPKKSKGSKKKSSEQNSKKTGDPATEAKDEKNDVAADTNQNDSETAANEKENKETETVPETTTEMETTTSDRANTPTTKDEDKDIQSKPLSPDDNEKGPTCEVAETVDPINDTPAKPVVDPWAVDGEYATFLSQNKNLEVYFIQDEAKLIDTGLVLRNSGKGCDASNIYDEEIINSSEAYYSDDEKEREAKNKRKGAGKKKNQQRNNNRQHQQFQPGHRQQRHFQSTGAPGFYGQPPPPPPPQQGYGYGQLPQGFHPMAQHQHPPQPYPSYHQYPPQSTFHRQVPPPPPPPPPHHGNNPYQGIPQQQHSVPPPPPRNPNEPPAYQY